MPDVSRIADATRFEWLLDARPTNYGSAREAILNQRIVTLLDALDAAEEHAATLLCARHQGESPTRQPCAACVEAARHEHDCKIVRCGDCALPRPTPTEPTEESAG